MQRTIVQPPALGDAALTELKHWLGINRPDEDPALAGLLASSLTVFEAFTGQAPLHQIVEEHVPIGSGWLELVSRPVHELVAAFILAEDGSRTAIDFAGNIVELRSAGTACARLLQPVEGLSLALQLRVGIAAEWAALPAPIAQGVVRLAAHHYRDRDSKSGAVPPASVTALWRPWRHVHLA